MKILGALRQWTAQVNQWLQFIVDANLPTTDLATQQRIRTIRAIVVPFCGVLLLLNSAYLLSGLITASQFVVQVPLLVLTLGSVYLTYTRHYQCGLLLFVGVLFFSYLTASLGAEDPKAIYGLTPFVIIGVFVASQFYPPRQIVWLAAGGMVVLGFGALLVFGVPTTADMTLVVIVPLLMLELILLANYTRHRRDLLMEQQTEALIESEGRFRSLFDQTFQIAVFIRPDGIIVDANDKTHRLLAATQEQGIGRVWWQLSLWDGVDRPMEQLQQDFAQVLNGQTVHFEIRFAVDQHKTRTYELWLRPVCDDSDNVYLVAVTGRDVSGLKRAQRQRNLEETRYRALFDAMGDGFIIVAPGGSIQAANRAATLALGYAPGELVGKSLRDVLADAEDLKRNRQGDAADIDPTLQHRILRRADGTLLPVEINPTRIVDEHGEPQYTQMVFRDLTLRRREERLQIEAQMERERTDMLSHFVTNVSHDFRTPLANIQTSAYLLRRVGLNNPQKSEEYLGVVDDALARLTELIENQLAAVRAAAPAPDGTHNDILFNVNELLQSTISGLQQDIDQQEHTVTLRLAQDMPLVLGDAKQIALAAHHVIQNAIKFTPPGGDIHVRSSAAGDTIYITVQDNGAGIAEADLAFIFDSLYRGDSARQQVGAGLGLTIAQRIVTAHGGSIQVESRVGEGSTFTIALPKMSAQRLQASRERTVHQAADLRSS